MVQSKTYKFGRKRDQRVALICSLIRSLIIHERIKTTEAKAKAIRPLVEKMVTRARHNNLANRRILLSRLNNDNKTVAKLFDSVAPRYTERPGGYTRIVKLPIRQKSGRKEAIIEFV